MMIVVQYAYTICLSEKNLLIKYIYIAICRYSL